MMKRTRKYSEKTERRGGRRSRSREEEDVQVGLQLPTIGSWPTDIQTLYLDGNNMLFVMAALRSLVLKKKNLRSAEKLLVALAKKIYSNNEVEQV